MSLGLITMTSSAANADSVAYEKVYFAKGSAKLTPTAKKELRQIAVEYAGATSVQVTGYVQSGKSSSNNKALSKARAKAVVKYLKARGLKATFTSSGKGLPASKPSSDKARRVTLKIQTVSAVAAPAPTAATHTVSGALNGSVPVGFLRLALGGPCDGIGNLNVSLDGAVDYASPAIQITPTCTANFSIPAVAAGSYTVTATIDIKDMQFVEGATADGWVVTNSGTIYTFTKTGFVVDSDENLPISPVFMYAA